jgi:hypothetical protein
MGGQMDLMVFGLSVSVIGSLLVFAGLAMIVGGVILLKQASGLKVQKDSHSSANADMLPVVLSAAVAAAIEMDAEQERLVAVLTAAVAAIWEDTDNGFIVRKVRRIQNGSAWQKAGREEQIYSRM